MQRFDIAETLEQQQIHKMTLDKYLADKGLRIKKQLALKIGYQLANKYRDEFKTNPDKVLEYSPFERKDTKVNDYPSEWLIKACTELREVSGDKTRRTPERVENKTTNPPKKRERRKRKRISKVEKVY